MVLNGPGAAGTAIIRMMLAAGVKDIIAVDENGKYTYTIPVSELDKPLIISSHSLKNNIWYDRTVTFRSDSLKKIDDAYDRIFRA